MVRRWAPALVLLGLLAGCESTPAGHGTPEAAPVPAGSTSPGLPVLPRRHRSDAARFPVGDPDRRLQDQPVPALLLPDGRRPALLPRDQLTGLRRRMRRFESCRGHPPRPAPSLAARHSLMPRGITRGIN